jgi:threonine 3-dehydrogenase
MTVKAILKKEKGPGLCMEEVPVPKMGGWNVLIRVRKAAICGTDLNIKNWGEWSQKEVRTPVIIGHEFMGIIEAVGEHVHGLLPGDRVTAEGHITCGICTSCQSGMRHHCLNTVGIGYHCDGAFAEYISVPARNVFKLPDTISDEEAAIFDPFGNAVHTALSFPLVGEDVLITGAGPIGIMAAAIARHAGARTVAITDVNPLRLELAKQMGATHAINVKEGSIDGLVPEGFTVGLEMSGNASAFDSMIQAMRPGGNIALLGILSAGDPVDWHRIIFRSLQLKGIYGREIFRTWHQMVALLEGGLDITPVITHRVPFEDYKKGFEIIEEGIGAKVILEMPA